MIELSLLPISCILLLPCFFVGKSIWFVKAQILDHILLGLSADCKQVLK